MSNWTKYAYFQHATHICKSTLHKDVCLATKLLLAVLLKPPVVSVCQLYHGNQISNRSYWESKATTTLS
jgi:hypothetical protein